MAENQTLADTSAAPTQAPVAGARQATDSRNTPRNRTPFCHHKHGCMESASRAFYRSFILAFAIRHGIGVLTRALTLLRMKPKALFNLHELFSEQHLVVRVESVKLGLFVGGMAGGFKAVQCLLRFIRSREDAWNSIIAGGLAGLSVCVQSPGTRRTLSLYLFVRILQLIYNALKKRGIPRLLFEHNRDFRADMAENSKYTEQDNSRWRLASAFRHADTLLFCLVSAQCMYAYVMRPDSIPSNFLEFITRTGPIDKLILRSVEKNNRHEPVDVDALYRYCCSQSPNPASVVKLSTPHPPIIGCDILHPSSPSCVVFVVLTWLRTLRKILPLYASLHIVPAVLLRTSKFLRKPLHVLVAAMADSVRSSSFLATFCASYQAVVCIYRAVAHKDHKSLYYIAGLLSSLSVLIDKKPRRSELVMYAMPRALESLYTVLRSWRVVPPAPPGGEVALFCLSTAALMYFYQYERDCMGPLLRGVVGHFVG